jgi:AcrR family transcriptional regulator
LALVSRIFCKLVGMAGLRERHMDRTRTAIIDAALRLFAEKGFGETTVDEIAEAAEVGRRTFFRYFPAKESVLFHDVESQIEAMVTSLRERPPEESPDQALMATMRRAASCFAEDADRRALMGKVAAENESLFSHHRAVIMRRMEDALAEQVARRRGLDTPDLATQAAVAAVLAAFGSAIRHWIVGGAQGSLPDMVETALDAAQAALAPDGMAPDGIVRGG